MKMNDMVTYLENRDFKVEKKYVTSEKKYKFTIIKNGIDVVGWFEYPSYTRDCPDLDMIQRNFLDNLMNEWCLKNIQIGEYCGADNDINTIGYKYFLNSIYGVRSVPQIKNVIFNDPATIVFWGDGTKTVVKCGEDDIFDPEKGLAMAITKKFFGNQGNYYNEIKKWVDKHEDTIYPNIPTPNRIWVDEFKKTLINIVDERLTRIEDNKALVELVNNDKGVAFTKEEQK